MNLILFGFRGIGKTYWGSRVAQVLTKPFFDTDEQIALEEGLSAPELYRKVGEKEFRTIEARIVQKIRPTGFVVALGGGAVLLLENRAHLQKVGCLVYLEGSFEKLKERKPASRLFYEERKFLYEQIVAPRVQVDRDPAEVLQELIEISRGL